MPHLKIPQKRIDIDYESSDDEFYDSSDDTADPGDEDGNQEDHLKKFNIETVAVGEWVKVGIYPNGFTNAHF